MKRLAVLLLAAGLALAALKAAAASASVEGVQMPAWVERGGKRTPLEPGMSLDAGDELRTGIGARLYLKLPDASLIRLGENASLRLLELEAEREGLFRAALRVLEGAFRFTTEVLTRNRRREVRITLRNVTAGVRGTDLWGRSTEAKQVVCLIEGLIEVQPEGEAGLTMDQPLQFYVREGGTSQPVSFVNPAQLAQWAAETDIAPGQGAARRGGAWKVVVASPDTQLLALSVYDRLRADGYAAHIRPERSGEGFVYQVRLASLPTRADAEALAARLGTTYGPAAPAVGR